MSLGGSICIAKQLPYYVGHENQVVYYNAAEESVPCSKQVKYSLVHTYSNDRNKAKLKNVYDLEVL